jgi:hypothetical protein
MTTQPSRDARRMIVRSLVVAGVFLAVMLVLTLLSPEPLSRDLRQRLIGVMFGLLVVGYANAAPKTLTPLARLRCTPAAEQAIRRFVAWTLVLGGLAYIAGWIFAPIDHADVIATGLLGTAFVTVIARVAWAKAARHRA